MAARGAACIRHMNDHRRTLAEPDGPTRVRTHGEVAARPRGRKTTGRAIYESRGALANILSQTPRAEEVTVNEPTDALSHAQTGVAALIACVVQTLNESDPSFQQRFLDRLERAYLHFRDNTEGPVAQELELLSGTRQLLTGWNPIRGQGKPFLQD